MLFLAFLTSLSLSLFPLSVCACVSLSTGSRALGLPSFSAVASLANSPESILAGLRANHARMTSGHTSPRRATIAADDEESEASLASIEKADIQLLEQVEGGALDDYDAPNGSAQKPSSEGDAIRPNPSAQEQARPPAGLSLKAERSTAGEVGRSPANFSLSEAVPIGMDSQEDQESRGASEKSLISQGNIPAGLIEGLPATMSDETSVPRTKEADDDIIAENNTGGQITRPPQTEGPTAAIKAIDRELPVPPTPSKEEEKRISLDRSEMAEVAKAFGVGIKVSDVLTMGTQSTSEAALRDKSSDLGIPESSTSTLANSPKTPRSGGLKIGKGPPPTTQASEEKPFDFNRFLDQMRHKSAGPVGEYVRSFIKGFTKKPYRVSDQTKLIFDFLDFISLRMGECEVWSKLSTAEFENATEAMEKLLMNRLYNFTFSPAVRKEGKWSVQTDDLERDRVLKQRIRLFEWINEEHLEVPTGSHSKGFIDFAMEELLKINHYKAPRDKVICILNCCKVIFGLIRHLSSEENADTFIPILIFVVLRSNPDHLISNVEYISRFRNPERLSSESGYYLSSLMGAVAFIETMDYTSLSNITQEQFEANVEKAVEKMSTLPESIESSPVKMSQIEFGEREKADGQSRGQSSTLMTNQGPSSYGEESARSLPTSANVGIGAAALAEDTKAFFQRTGEAARAGIGASLGKPMGALGRLFSEGLEGPRTPGGTSPLPVSGRATPEMPLITAGGGVASSAPSSARSRMWGLFGVDGEEAQSKQQQQQPEHQQRQQSSAFARSISSSSSLNFGNWSRSMREEEEEEEEPQTPNPEELRQGRFSKLLARNTQHTPQETTSMQSQLGNNAPRAQRQQRYIPQRTDSIDPYSINDDEATMASGVRTPDGDGSDVENSSPTQATVGGRPRISDLGGFLPSFLSEQNIGASAPLPASQQQRQSPHRREQPMPIGEVLDNEEAAIATAQIEQAHLAAGVETLKSIFPDVDPSVSRLVLEDCQGDLRRTIDKLLEM